jgi:hypothetical protein
MFFQLFIAKNPKVRIIEHIYTAIRFIFVWIHNINRPVLTFTRLYAKIDMMNIVATCSNGTGGNKCITRIQRTGQ